MYKMMVVAVLIMLPLNSFAAVSIEPGITIAIARAATQSVGASIGTEIYSSRREYTELGRGIWTSVDVFYQNKKNCFLSTGTPVSWQTVLWEKIEHQITVTFNNLPVEEVRLVNDLTGTDTAMERLEGRPIWQCKIYDFDLVVGANPLKLKVSGPIDWKHTSGIIAVIFDRGGRRWGMTESIVTLNASRIDKPADTLTLTPKQLYALYYATTGWIGAVKQTVIKTQAQPVIPTQPDEVRDEIEKLQLMVEAAQQSFPPAQIRGIEELVAATSALAKATEVSQATNQQTSDALREIWEKLAQLVSSQNDRPTRASWVGEAPAQTTVTVAQPKVWFSYHGELIRGLKEVPLGATVVAHFPATDQITWQMTGTRNFGPETIERPPGTISEDFSLRSKVTRGTYTLMITTRSGLYGQIVLEVK